VACVWASADSADTEVDAVTEEFVSSSADVHPRVVQNLAVLSADPGSLIKARTVTRLPHANGEDTVSGTAFDQSMATAQEVAAEDELDLSDDRDDSDSVDAEDAADAEDSEDDAEDSAEDAAEDEAEEESDVSDEIEISDDTRFASASPLGGAAAAATKVTAPAPAATAPDAAGPGGPPKPKGVSIDASAPTPPPPAQKPKKAPAAAAAEPTRVAFGSLDGPVQRHGDKPDAVLESVKDIIAVPEKDGLPTGTLDTTKVVGAASCGKGCSRKLPVMVGWAGLNEHPAHLTGRRVTLPGDKERVRARHEALKVPSKYSWQQRDLDKARVHLKRSSKRIKDLRRARKKVGDAPLARPVVV